MKNSKGFSLLEMMVIITILGMMMWGFNKMLVISVKQTKKITTKLETATNRALDALSTNPATAPGADQRTYFPTLNQCLKLGGAVKGNTQWYAKRTDSRVVSFFKNSANCSNGGIGTLTAQTNPTYDDDVTDTFWNVSGDGSSLRIWVHKLNLPQ